MIYVYGLYVVFSGLLLALFNRKSLKEWLLKIVIVSFIPVIGWAFPIVWPKIGIANRGEMLDEYMNQTDIDIVVKHVAILEKVDKNKELNVVSIEDALLVSKNATRRRIMIDVLKEDALNYLDVLQTAVQNDDTETSHCAVSAIMEVKRKLSISMQELTAKYEHDKHDKQLARNLAKVLKRYMRSGFLDERTLRKYKYTYINTLQQIIGDENDDVGFAFDEKIKFEIELGDFSEAEKTCLHYLGRYPLREEPYLRLMEFYFITKSISNLQFILDELKQSEVVFTNRALTVVRYWSKGENYEGKLS